MPDTLRPAMGYNNINKNCNSRKKFIGHQSFFSLPTALAIIACSYINYIAITYYLELDQNSIVTIIYLCTAYSLGLASILLSGRMGFKVNYLDIWIGILIVIIAAGYVTSLGIAKELVFILLYLVLNYLLARHLRFTELSRFFWVLFFALIQILAYGLLNLPSIYQDWQSSNLRPTLFGTGASLSALGADMGLCLVLAINLLPLIKGAKVKFLVLLLAMLAETILLLSCARTAIISSALVLLIYLSNIKTISTQKKFCMLFFACATLLILQLVEPKNMKEFNQTESSAELIYALTTPLNSQDNLTVDSEFIDSEGSTLGTRLLIIRSCLVKFSENMLLGYGPVRLPLPHNAFLQVIFEHGLFAGAILILICSKIIYELLSIIKLASDITRQYATMLVSLLIYILLYLQVLGTTLTMNRLFILIGVSVSFINHFNSANNCSRTSLESI
jgi:hypothetical protein